MDLGLADQVAFVTGASGGIGAAIARALAAEGARVALGYHSGKEAVDQSWPTSSGPAEPDSSSGTT